MTYAKWWIDKWHVSFFVLKIFSQLIFIFPINLPKFCKFPFSNCSECSYSNWPGCIYIYIYDMNILISVYANCIESIYSDLGGLVAWYLKRWSEFDSQLGLVLSTVNSFQLMIKFFKFESGIYIYDNINFITEYQIRK